MNSKDLSNNTNDAACDNCHLVHALDQVVDEVLSVAMVSALNVMQSLLVHASLYNDTRHPGSNEYILGHDSIGKTTVPYLSAGFAQYTQAACHHPLQSVM